MTTQEPIPLTQASQDYLRIEKAIVFLQSSFLEQPRLAAVAHAAHVSEFHFQRLFTRWAGISPKRFLQFLTVENAKRQLAGSKAVLETALDAGLSSPGRLHDLFVSVEAVTPGEFKSHGAGIQIEYGVHPSPFGPCVIGTTRRGVCWLGFFNGAGQADAIAGMKTHWSGASFIERPAATRAVAHKIFRPLKNSEKSPLGLLLMGTNFQLQVWKAVLRIPP